MTVKIENLKLEQLDAVELTDEELSQISGGKDKEPTSGFSYNINVIGLDFSATITLGQ